MSNQTEEHEVGIEAALGVKKMTLHQCQELAKDLGYDKAMFDLVGPKGRKKCKWLDAYFGMFQIEGEEKHFMMASQLTFANDLWCENLRLPA